ncbi:flagellar basal-body MS-ring/collar protein FliF [Planococcus salinus]|uniref:Flagellar M-ring protein n=1 Tax=Planococcus salinus TaxID=1848460 RepID=A0A3M8P515_9BACL|nr:flagellar basal-body MS-ring/collar protein FliF [Planococcus salinus]RNF38757.1 flagellar M-ring protein FliF [Planococcus salinus]
MKERLTGFKNKAKESWSGLSPAMKWTIAGSFAGTILLLSMLVFFTTQSAYSVLYSGLSPAETGEIKAAIEERGIPVEVSADGKTVSVPNEEIANLKVDLAAEGIPESGNVNYSIFSENMGLGMTDRHFDVVERDAMQNELSGLVRQIEGVSDANVMITLPKENIWVTEEEQVATASVVVSGEPSFQLDQKQVNGLYHLISKSVPNLPTEQIVIMNQNGQVFHMQEENQLDTTLSVYQQQRDIQRDIEQDIQRELQQMLGLLLGYDKVVVSVMTSMDFTKEKREENLVEPVNGETNEGIDISVERIVESYSSEGGDVDGATGTDDTEIPNNPAVDGEGNVDSEKTEERINREVNRINRQIEMSPYVIDDITINVGVEPPIAENPDSLTAQNIFDIENLLKNTVSTTLSMNGAPVDEIDLANRISVFATEFHGKPAVAEEEPVTAWLDKLPNNLVLVIATAVVLLVILIVLIVLLRRSKRKREEEFDREIFGPPLTPPVMDGNTAEAVEEEIDLSDFDSKTNPKRKTIEKLAKERPEDFARLLRSWMSEE